MISGMGLSTAGRGGGEISFVHSFVVPIFSLPVSIGAGLREDALASESYGLPPHADCRGNVRSCLATDLLTPAASDAIFALIFLAKYKASLLLTTGRQPGAFNRASFGSLQPGKLWKPSTR